MVATTRRSARAEPVSVQGKKKTVLKDITNDKRKEVRRSTRKTSDVGPSTAQPVEAGVVTRSRSAKKPVADSGRTGAAGNSEGLEAKDRAPATKLNFNDVECRAVSSADDKKRKSSEVDDVNDNKRQRRVTRAAARIEAVVEAEAKKEVTDVDLTCDERLVPDRGLTLASTVSGTGVDKHEDVYPFSVEGGRRSNERKNALSPYVQNGHLFSIGMRQDLVDWMSQQHGTLDLVDETLHLALRYLDTFLVRRGTEAFLARNGAGSEPVPALPLGPLPEKQVMYLNSGEQQPLCNKLKRLGITCIFVAAKVTEVSAPSAYDFANAAEVSTFTRSQLLLAERALLRELDYYLYHPTASSFSSAYLSVTIPYIKKEGFIDGSAHNEYTWEDDPCEDIKDIVDYLLEASAVSHASLEFAPSVAAAAAIGYTLARVYDIPWEQLGPLHKISGYREEEMTKVFDFFDRLVSDAYDSEEHGRGLHVNDKYEKATGILWRKLFF